MLRAAVATLSALALVTLAGCGGATTEEAAEPTSSATPSPTPTPSEDAGSDKAKPRDQRSAAVPETLEFTGTTVEGERFEGASLAGRPTLLWFWAPWCPSCRGQIPQVEGLADEHGADLQVVGIGSLDSAEAIAGFAEDVDGVTHLEDEDGELWRRFEVAEQSSFVLLDGDGKVAFRTGYGGSDDLDAQVAALVG